MADHGFGTGRVNKTDGSAIVVTELETIAERIAEEIPEVQWVHVVEASTDTEACNLIWEMTEKVENQGIKNTIRRYASDAGYNIHIGTHKIKDKSFTKKERKHPK